MKQQDPNYTIQKPDCKLLTEKWYDEMNKLPQKISSKPNSVQFSAKLILNEEMLDSDLLERIRHNEEYNDDRIFDTLSIFRQPVLEIEDDEETRKTQNN